MTHRHTNLKIFDILYKTTVFSQQPRRVWGRLEHFPPVLPSLAA